MATDESKTPEEDSETTYPITCRRCGVQAMRKLDEEITETIRLSPDEDPFSTKKYTYQCVACGATIQMTV